MFKVNKEKKIKSLFVCAALCAVVSAGGTPKFTDKSNLMSNLSYATNTAATALNSSREAFAMQAATVALFCSNVSNLSKAMIGVFPLCVVLLEAGIKNSSKDNYQFHILGSAGLLAAIPMITYLVGYTTAAIAVSGLMSFIGYTISACTAWKNSGWHAFFTGLFGLITLALITHSSIFPIFLLSSFSSSLVRGAIVGTQVFSIICDLVAKSVNNSETEKTAGKTDAVAPGPIN